MANQIVVSAGAKVRNLSGVLTATSGVVSFLPIDVSLGIPQLDVNGKILVSQLPNSVMEYKGTWDASTNTPTLANGTGNQGDVYLCNVAGTVNFGAGAIAFFVGDQVIYSGSIWQRASGATGTVTSVAVTETGDSLNITGSPITTSGTINIGFNGTNLQYVNGAGNLTTFPILTGYVPYTGATQDVDLGAFSLNGKSLHIKGTAGNGHLGLKHQSAAATGSANESLIYADTLGDLSWQNANLYLSKFITSANTANRSYTFPNATGTVALTSDISYPVTSVFGRTGAVVAVSADYNTSQVTEVTNLYYTDTRARLALSFVAGSGAYNNTTGVITIPTNNNQITNGAGYTTNVGTVTSVAATGGTGISITGSPITTSGTITITNSAPDQVVALTASTGISVTGTYPNFTITNTSPSSGGTVTSVAALTIGTTGTDLSSTVATSTTTPVITLNVPTASAANRGALSSADWTTFNNKQGTITLTTTGTSGAATFSANTLNIPNYGSALSGYLPLTGGTLTGALSGTSATFSSSVTATSFIPSGASVPTNGMYLSAANTLNFATNTTNRLSISSGGAASFSSTADVPVSVTSTAATSTFVLDNTNANLWGGVYAVRVNGVDKNYFGTLGSLLGTTSTDATIWATAGNGFRVYTNGNNLRLNIDSSGNTAIGYTTNPSLYKLDVNGTGRFSGTITSSTGNNTRLFTSIGATTGYQYMDMNNTTGRLVWGINGSTANAIASNSLAYGGVLYASNSLQLGVDGDMKLTIASTGAATFSSGIATLGYTASTSYAALFNGSVGIGTSSPQSKLHIGESGAAAQLWLQRTDGYNPIKLLGGTLADGNGFKITMNTTDAFAITSGGNLLVGTTTDSGYKLDVNGTGRFKASDSQLTLAHSGGTYSTVLVTNSIGNFYVQPNGSFNALTIATTGAATFSSTITATAGIFSTITSITNGDQSGARLTIANTGTGGQSINLIAGNPNVDNTGFSIAYGNVNMLRFTSTGAATFSSTLGIGGVADSVKSGTYTPTINTTTNIASSSVGTWQYLRVGNTVTVSGSITITPTLAVSTTSFNFSLPINSTFATGNDCAGTGVDYNATTYLMVNGNSGAANFGLGLFKSTTTSAMTLSIQFTYQII